MKNQFILTCESMTSDEYKNAGADFVIDYGNAHSPFGQCFIAVTHRGICKLAFFDTDAEKVLIENEFYAQWAKSAMIKNDAKIQLLAETIFTPKENKRAPLKLLLKGSSFQINVWKALLSVPEAHLKSYQAIAIDMGKPTTVRAVASAIAKNNIAYLVPCHRIVQKNGNVGQYRWGIHRKQAIIAWEANS